MPILKIGPRRSKPASPANSGNGEVMHDSSASESEMKTETVAESSLGTEKSHVHGPEHADKSDKTDTQILLDEF